MEGTPKSSILFRSFHETKNQLLGHPEMETSRGMLNTLDAPIMGLYSNSVVMDDHSCIGTYGDLGILAFKKPPPLSHDGFYFPTTLFSCFGYSK